MSIIIIPDSYQTISSTCDQPEKFTTTILDLKAQKNTKQKNKQSTQVKPAKFSRFEKSKTTGKTG